jgi:hypothetical protein
LILQEHLAMKRCRNSHGLLLPVVLLVTIRFLGWGCPATDSYAADTWCAPPAKADGEIVFNVVMLEDEDEDPAAAGKAAATKLKTAMGSAPLRAVLLSECFEDEEYKAALIEGICSVLPAEIVFGKSTYGSFTQAGCTDFDSVCLLGIGGEGVSVATSLVTELGTSKLTLEEHEAEISRRLHAGGAKLAGKLRRTKQDQLLILCADAHSPKNRYLVEGAQKVVGGKFPITGGSANKNAGQTFVYYGGTMYRDSAVAVMLSGDFRVSLAGRQAKDNDRVISTARDGAREAMDNFSGKPAAVLAFNCAGRRGKLDRMEDELKAMQEVLGNELPLYGCYCAGEIGPVDVSDKNPAVLSGGSGWHVMFTVVGK